MYVVDDRDRVVELPEVPQSSIGAPLPVARELEANESRGLLTAGRDHANARAVPRWVTVVEQVSAFKNKVRYAGLTYFCK